MNPRTRRIVTIVVLVSFFVAMMAAAVIDYL
jgi:hypothetical protein